MSKYETNIAHSLGWAKFAEVFSSVNAIDYFPNKNKKETKM